MVRFTSGVRGEHEVGALEFAEYGKTLKADRIQATARLLAGCILDENGEPLLTVEEAAPIVSSARVSMAFVNAIMDLSGFRDDEKEPDAS